MKTEGGEIIQKTITGLTEIIEAHYQVNSKPLAENEPVFFLFPCFFTGKEGWGEWMFASEDTATASQGFTLDFFLEMSRLGSISIHVTCQDNALSGEFRVSKHGVSGHVEEHLPELQTILQNIGYHPVSLKCREYDHDIYQELQKKITSHAGLHKFALVDVKA
jgi:hypothetical protein